MKTATQIAGIPSELAVALEGDPRAGAAFCGMPPSHRAEYCRYVGEAKKTETRQRRATHALEMIHTWAHDRAARTGTGKQPAAK